MQSCDLGYADPELKLLLHCLSSQCQKPPQAILKASDGIDWPLFLGLVQQRHRVSGQVLRNLKTVPAAPWIPEDVMAGLKKNQVKNTHALMQKTGILIRLLKLFDAHHIRALPYKGPFLGLQLFGDIVTRNSNDIDILVPQKDIGKAISVMQKKGFVLSQLPYTPSNRQFERLLSCRKDLEFTHPETGMIVELHLKLFDDADLNISFDRLWDKRAWVSLGATSYPVINRDDTLIILMIHGAMHHWRRLFWLNDIQMILQDFSESDWQVFGSRVSALRLERLVTSSLMLLRSLFKLPIPDRFLGDFHCDAKICFIVKHALKCVKESDQQFFGARLPKMESFAAKTFLTPSLSGKLMVLAEPLMVPDFEYIDLPDNCFFLYYLFRPYFWFFRKFTGIKPARPRMVPIRMN